mgnify:CR=1 FL=1
MFVSRAFVTLEKFFGDEVYSNDDLSKIGFKSKKNIEQFHETSI